MNRRSAARALHTAMCRSHTLSFPRTARPRSRQPAKVDVTDDGARRAADMRAVQSKLDGPLRRHVHILHGVAEEQFSRHGVA